jgi:hypothetical protein
MKTGYAIVYAVKDGQRLCALLYENKLWHLSVEPQAGTPFGYGAIVRAKILQPLAGNQFLADIGDSQPALLESPQKMPLTIGASLIAQIKRPPQLKKGAAVTTDLRWPLRSGTYHFDAMNGSWQSDTARPEPEGISVTASAWVAQGQAMTQPGMVTPLLSEAQQILLALPGLDQVYFADLASRQDWLQQIESYPDLLATDHTIVPANEFNHIGDWQEQWHAATMADYRHSSGCKLFFESAHTLALVDVDQAGQAMAHVTANAALVPEIARLIAVKNFSGIVLVDFLKMSRPAERQQISDLMQQWLSRSVLGGRVFGFTATGLLELTRPRRFGALPPYTIWFTGS